LIYRDGRNSRWIFGWSGLLSCYSNLWTRQRIFMAMLNGLSLLAIKSANNVTAEEMNVDVRSLMVGYASFAISNRAIGKRIASIKKKELLKRYSKNLENACRNMGGLAMFWKFPQKLLIWTDCPRSLSDGRENTSAENQVRIYQKKVFRTRKLRICSGQAILGAILTRNINELQLYKITLNVSSLEEERQLIYILLFLFDDSRSK